jgi:hypothetical protein
MTFRVLYAVLEALSFVLFVLQAGAESQRSNPAASRLEALNIQTQRLLAEPSVPYPDPWNPSGRPGAFHCPSLRPSAAFKQRQESPAAT